MRILLAIFTVAIVFHLAGCDTIPSAGVNATNSGVSTSGGWGPVSGGVNSNGSYGVNVR